MKVNHSGEATDNRLNICLFLKGIFVVVDDIDFEFEPSLHQSFGLLHFYFV